MKVCVENINEVYSSPSEQEMGLSSDNCSRKGYILIDKLGPSTLHEVHKTNTNDLRFSLLKNHSSSQEIRDNIVTIRHNIQKMITNMILHRLPKLSVKKSNVHFMAERLERELFLHAKTFDEYRDEKTLKRRVKLISICIGKRAALRKKMASADKR